MKGYGYCFIPKRPNRFRLVGAFAFDSEIILKLRTMKKQQLIPLSIFIVFGLFVTPKASAQIQNADVLNAPDIVYVARLGLLADPAVSARPLYLKAPDAKPQIAKHIPLAGTNQPF